ncbi:DcaP family trimeric outer membrane transporter [Chitinophaga sp. HK235]|uniref:DcaP family trimeric outer membrane transporter n=1 Tax=Chitinophaga sp. HK235 TaxID=2952571 RepID=UPI001BA6EFC9|nr:DcaP family trimeric outer membrane transporter [Chitinophaga sp. HK235]
MGRKLLLTTLLVSGMLSVLEAQTLDSLRRRIDSLEAKVSKIENRIIRPQPERRTETRSNLEAGGYGGFVVADVHKTQLTIGGFVQGDFIYDFKEMGNKEAFAPSSIPINNEDEGQLTFAARQTRFTILSASDTRLGELKTLLEVDLFNSNGAAIPRLRHAWGQLGKWGGGQTWSTFMDIDVFPNILDYQGPNAMAFGRQIQVRYTGPLTKKSTLAFSMESPGSDTKLPADSGLTSRQLFPDVVAQYRYNFTDATHIQLAGLFHPITYDNYLDRDHTNIGWGLNLTGTIETSVRGKDIFVYGTTYGHGIARYIIDLNGLGLDAIAKTRTIVQNIPVWTVMGFYDFWWSDKFSSTIGYAYLRMETKAYQPPTDLQSTQYGVVNLLFYPSYFVKAGIEFLYGKKKNIDGSAGENSRIQCSMMYKF